MVKAKVFIYRKRFEGFPKETDLKLVEELPPLSQGEFLAEAVYLSVDPYMRAYGRALPTGNTFIGQQIARIVESKNKGFPVGKYIVATFGWRTHTISNGMHNPSQILPMTLLPDFQGLPESLGLGLLGMPGQIAWVRQYGATNTYILRVRERNDFTVKLIPRGGAIHCRSCIFNSTLMDFCLFSVSNQNHHIVCRAIVKMFD